MAKEYIGKEQPLQKAIKLQCNYSYQRKKFHTLSKIYALSNIFKTEDQNNKRGEHVEHKWMITLTLIMSIA